MRKKPQNAVEPPQARRPSPIELRVDRVVLEGFALSPSQSGVFQTALEVELTRLLTLSGLPANVSEAGIALNTLPLSATLPPDASPAVLGRDLARVLHAGLGGSNGQIGPAKPSETHAK